MVEDRVLTWNHDAGYGWNRDGRRTALWLFMRRDFCMEGGNGWLEGL